VKPANVLLSGRHAYLSDFGLTRTVDAEAHLTDTGERLGTVDFMSPEQLRGQRTDARSDVYALGCLLYTVLTGKPPFHRSSAAATVTAHLEDAPPRVAGTPGVPEEFDAVLQRALAKDPEQRFPSAGDLGRAALAAARGHVTSELGHSVARGEAAPLAETVALDGETTRLPAPPTAPTAPVALKRNRRRNLVIEAVVITAFLVVAVVVVAIALAGNASDPNRPLSSSDVSGLARAFARAYAHEDAHALGALLSPDVQRVSAADVQRGRTAVLAAYRRQFRSQVTRGYELDGLRVEPGPVGRAQARFKVLRASRPPITGQVVIGVERRHGRPRIRLIATESRT
jgi:serine/threonine-protein kinase